MSNIKMLSGAICLINRAMSMRETNTTCTTLGRDYAVTKLPCSKIDPTYKINLKLHEYQRTCDFSTEFGFFHRSGLLKVVLLSKSDTVGSDITLGKVFDYIEYLGDKKGGGKPSRKNAPRRRRRPKTNAVISVTEENVREFKSTLTFLIKSIPAVYGSATRTSVEDEEEDVNASETVREILDVDPVDGSDHSNQDPYEPKSWAIVEMRIQERYGDVSDPDPAGPMTGADPGPSSSSTSTLLTFCPGGVPERSDYDTPRSPGATSCGSDWDLDLDAASVSTRQFDINLSIIEWKASDFDTPRSEGKPEAESPPGRSVPSQRRLASTPVARLDEALRT